MERAKESNAKALHAKVGEGNLRRFSICSFLYFMLWKGICACLQFSHKQLLQLEKNLLLSLLGKLLQTFGSDSYCWLPPL